MKALKVALLTAALVAAAMSAAADPSLERGNEFYRIIINGSDRLWQGNAAVLTGPSHPATIALGRPGEVTGIKRDCPTCSGYDDASILTVRSHAADTDYRLGRSLRIVPQADPGFTCVEATDLAWPRITPVIVDGEERGAAATWIVSAGPETLQLENRAVVHGEGFLSSAVERTVSVRNIGAARARIGVRVPLLLRMTPEDIFLSSAATWHVVERHDGLAGSVRDVETEWTGDEPSAWQLHPGGLTYPNPYIPYQVGGRIHPTPALVVQPTPPDLLQATRSNLVGGTVPGTEGALDHCFSSSIQDPPRDLRRVDQGAMVSFWGATESTAIELEPGQEFSATQYLVAYQEYPVAARTDGPHVAPCEGAITRVRVRGEAIPIEPTSGTFHFLWRSDDPRVTFEDATAPETDAIVRGPGVFPISLSTFIGAYEAAASTTVEVVDATPPRFVELRASPDVLWPPNHRHVPVSVTALVEDDCDPAPAIRLVSVTSSEPDDSRGDGRTVGDISGASLGTDDRRLLLRAERDGRGPGRTYTLTYEAEDAAGNVATGRVTISVPHDARRAR